MQECGGAVQQITVMADDDDCMEERVAPYIIDKSHRAFKIQVSWSAHQTAEGQTVKAWRQGQHACTTPEKDEAGLACVALSKPRSERMLPPVRDSAEWASISPRRVKSGALLVRCKDDFNQRLFAVRYFLHHLADARGLGQGDIAGFQRKLAGNHAQKC